MVRRNDSETLQGSVREHAESGATVSTDEAKAHMGLAPDYEHESVYHSGAEYVCDMAHTNELESFRSMLKRAHDGTFRKMSPKHLHRYINEFAGKQNTRDS